MKIKSILALLIISPAFATDPDPAAQKTVASKAYVDTKQDIIQTGLITFEGNNDNIMLPALTSYDIASGLVANKFGIFEQTSLVEDSADSFLVYMNDNLELPQEFDYLIPTVASVGAVYAEIESDISRRQFKIAQSGKFYSGSRLISYNENGSSYSSSWLNTEVKGTGLVTKTSTDGVVGERKIFEASDVTNYHATGLTQNQKDIQDISIPTVGAMMTAITNSITAAAPSGTPNTLANYDSTGALGSGIAVASAASYDSTTGALENGSAIPNITALETKQNKMTCAGWDSDAHTDEHCWLWSIAE